MQFFLSSPPAAMNILVENNTDQPVLWINSFEETIVVILYNDKKSLVRASRLSPQDSIYVPPGYFLERLD
ncbi:MAG: hypothetical protein QNJ55_28630 [Xenococcus sp. MO_188.B8]|nr:hypothetical protein [Xenococcus sp. MO_188.B8]